MPEKKIVQLKNEDICMVQYIISSEAFCQIYVIMRLVSYHGHIYSRGHCTVA